MDNIIRCDTREEARIVVPELMKRAKRPDGIFAVNDLTAVEAMRMIQECGFNVPEDVSVVGFTSGMISDITCPTLSSVEQHGYLVGREAVKLLIDRLEKKHDLPFQTIVIKTEMVVKGSSSVKYLIILSEEIITKFKKRYLSSFLSKIIFIFG